MSMEKYWSIFLKSMRLLSLNSFSRCVEFENWEIPRGMSLGLGFV